MPLILAIEPDQRQAAQLSVVVRRRVGAELILVDTTERALDAIGNRVPDLLLVPALLSPQDDAALATALRVIAAATHVQMLTIPVLGAPRSKARVGGVLSALRRDRPRSAEPDGCDPSVFAEQVASYLQRAAEERASAVADMVPVEAEEFAPAVIATAPLAETAAEEVIATVEEAATVDVVAAEPFVEAAAEPVIATVEEAATVDVVAAEPFVEAAVDSVIATVEEATTVDVVAAEPFIEAAAEPVIATVEEAATVDVVAATVNQGVVAAVEEVEAGAPVEEAIERVEEVQQLAADESVSLALEAAVRALFLNPEPAMPPTTDPQPTPPAKPEAALALDEFMAVLEEMPLPVIEASEGGDWAPPVIEDEETVDNEIDLTTEIEDTAAPSEGWDGTVGDLEAAEAHVVAPEAADADVVLELEAVPADVVLEPEAGEPDRPASGPQAAKGGREWVELIESLRHDVERLRTERSKPAPEQPAPHPKRSDRKVRPVQDEWGFFDPEQCGFAALLEKLAEVTESEETSRA